MLGLFKKKKYVLYCRQGKTWEIVAELENPVTLTEAKALYGEDCEQLRLELHDDKGKRLKMLWVEPRRKQKKETPTLADYLAEFKLLTGAVASMIRDFREMAKDVVNESSSKGIDDLLKLVLSFAKARQNTFTPVQTTFQQMQMEEVNEPLEGVNTEEIEKLLAEHTKKDLEDIANAPCREDKCEEVPNG